MEDNETFYRLARKINTIKESYITARLLLVQSNYYRKDLNIISDLTTLVDPLDYSLNDIFIGLLKASYKEACNVLDKIAFFLKDYLNLNIKDRNIYYHTVWFNKGKKEKGINPIFKEISNYALFSLYSINLELGHNQYIKKIRNLLTHRDITIYDLVYPNSEKTKFQEFQINDFIDITVKMFYLIKCSIIYLINYVNSNEREKIDNDLILPIYPVNK